LGLDAGELSPRLVTRCLVTIAHTRAYKKGAIVMAEVAGQPVSASTLERLAKQVGKELAERRDGEAGEVLAAIPEEPPELAVVECDGGRIRTREPGHGPGVHLSGKGWNETKNAILIRGQRQTFAEDPQPDPPECFCNPAHVAKIAETEALSVASPQSKTEVTVAEDDGEPPPLVEEADWRPKRLVRTVLSSLADSETFGEQMAHEAKSRRFGEARAKAFLGDGLSWNWTIWKRHFSHYTPISISSMC
jgi:hypothetical protein